jgi:tetratricopeptide (TPR) repeat protein
MNDVAPRLHPEPEALAAFLEGNLTDQELKTVIDHLSSCEDCRSQIGGAAEFERENEAAGSGAAEEPNRFRLPMRWLPHAAMAVLVVGGMMAVYSRYTDPLRQLQGPTRGVEARVTDADYASYKSPTRATAQDNTDYGKLGNIGRLEDKVKANPSVKNLHRLARGYLATGDARKAAETLTKALELAPGDPDLLSDLAAARVAQMEYQLAVDASVLALEHNPSLAPAAFNHALALERLHKPREAKAAWENYLKLDPSSQWAEEAKGHIKELHEGL